MRGRDVRPTDTQPSVQPSEGNPVVLKRRVSAGSPGAELSVGDEQDAETPTSQATGDPPAAQLVKRLYSMQGAISALECKASSEAVLTLNMGGLTMKLHATDLSKVPFLTSTGDAQPHAMTCPELRGRSLRVL
jgi:hypothetical protein